MSEIEIWKDIEGYEGLYQVSNMGRVKSFPRNTTKGKILKPKKNCKGYLCLNLYKDGKRKSLKVHRLVALTFILNPENLPYVKHKNEIKTDNRVENLEFCTIERYNWYSTRIDRIIEAHKGKQLSEETKRKLSEANKGKPNYKNRKPILQYTKDNVFIREWESIISINLELNINIASICLCCQGKLKTCGGYIWKYKDIV